MDPAEEKAFAGLAPYCWHCINGQPDAEGPVFAYTVGFQRTFSHPKVVVFGQASQVMHGMFNRIAERLPVGHPHHAGQSYWGLALRR